jgi:hypothetical protein
MYANARPHYWAHVCPCLVMSSVLKTVLRVPGACTLGLGTGYWNQEAHTLAPCCRGCSCSIAVVAEVWMSTLKLPAVVGAVAAERWLQKYGGADLCRTDACDLSCRDLN